MGLNRENRVEVMLMLTAVSSKPSGSSRVRPFTALDNAMSPHTVHVIFYYARSPFEDFDVDSVRIPLSEILTLYPPVVGRVAKNPDGIWEVKCNDAGLRIFRAKVCIGLDEWLRSADGHEENDLTVWEDMPEDPNTWSPFRLQKKMNIESSSSSSPSSHTLLNKQQGGWRAIKYIIANESFEKLSSMSLIGNLSVYLSTKYNLGGVFLVNVVNIWFGSCNVLSLVGAFVSDAYIGRFWTLLFGSIASFVGMGIMTLTAGFTRLRPKACKDPTNCSNPPAKWQLGILLSGLALLAIGAGGIRPCNIAFGADQFDTSTKKGKKQLETFFNWWYFSFTVALVIALTGVVYIQSNISWLIGFVIPTACLALSITSFLIGQHTYICSKPEGSVFSDMVKVVVAACKKRKVKSGTNITFYIGPSSTDGSFTTLVKDKQRLSFFDKASVVTSQNELNEEGLAKYKWRLCSVQQVNNLKCVSAILPVWVTGIACFMLTDQQNIYGILQAMQMDRTFGPHNFQVPAGWMNLVSMIALAIWISLYECVLIPTAKLITGRKKRLSMKHRIEIGIVMGIVCMIVAGFLEKKRRALALRNGSFVSPVPIVMLLPQFVLAGLTEAFSAVALMEFLTVRMPEHMRTVAGAIFFLSSSIASYICTLLINVIDAVTRKEGHSWLGDKDLNKNRLENYFFVIAGIQVVNLFYFRFFASRFATENNKGH